MSRTEDRWRADRAEKEGRQQAMEDAASRKKGSTLCPYQPESTRPMAFSWIYGYTKIRAYRGIETNAGKQQFGSGRRGRRT